MALRLSQITAVLETLNIVSAETEGNLIELEELIPNTSAITDQNASIEDLGQRGYETDGLGRVTGRTPLNERGLEYDESELVNYKEYDRNTTQFFNRNQRITEEIHLDGRKYGINRLNKPRMYASFNKMTNWTREVGINERNVPKAVQAFSELVDDLEADWSPKQFEKFYKDSIDDAVGRRTGRINWKTAQKNFRVRQWSNSRESHNISETETRVIWQRGAQTLIDETEDVNMPLIDQIKPNFWSEYSGIEGDNPQFTTRQRLILDMTPKHINQFGGLNKLLVAPTKRFNTYYTRS
jgi:hypothetical protein